MEPMTHQTGSNQPHSLCLIQRTLWQVDALAALLDDHYYYSESKMRLWRGAAQCLMSYRAKGGWRGQLGGETDWQGPIMGTMPGGGRESLVPVGYHVSKKTWTTPHVEEMECMTPPI